MGERPGQALARRPLHFFWIADCSGSMLADGKIHAMNVAIREALPHLRDVATQNPFAEVLVRVVQFSTGASWHLAEPTPVDRLTWTDLVAQRGGYTDMGKALNLVASQLSVPPMEARSLPPALVLISDGQPTDDFDQGLANLLEQPWGRKAVRIAVAIGRDADHGVLQRFMDDPEMRPLQASNPEQLTDCIRWAATVATRAASAVREPDGGLGSYGRPSPPEGGVDLTW